MGPGAAVSTAQEPSQHSLGLLPSRREVTGTAHKAHGRTGGCRQQRDLTATTRGCPTRSSGLVGCWLGGAWEGPQRRVEVHGGVQGH